MPHLYTNTKPARPAGPDVETILRKTVQYFVSAARQETKAGAMGGRGLANLAMHYGGLLMLRTVCARLAGAEPQVLSAAGAAQIHDAVSKILLDFDARAAAAAAS